MSHLGIGQIKRATKDSMVAKGEIRGGQPKVPGVKVKEPELVADDIS